MTRDGFIELRLKHTGGFTKAAVPAEMLREMIANEVDFYISAGMLKLDEPKSGNEIAKDYLSGRCRLPPSHGGDCVLMSEGEAGQIIELLDRAGLKLVEK